MSLNSSLPSRSPHTLPLSRTALSAYSTRLVQRKWRDVAQHTYARPIGGSDGSRTTLHVHLGLRIGPTLKQASALVREGDTHTPEEKEKEKRTPHPHVKIR